MPIHLIHQEFGQIFYNLLDSTKNEINLISPFVGLQTASRMADWLIESQDVRCTIITRFTREEFIRGASSIEGLNRLLKAGAKIYALQNLHTKLYTFDNHSVIMGSANFTLNGFYKNHEFGMFMDDEPIFTEECLNYFDNLLEDIKKAGDFLITPNKMDNEIKQVNTAVLNRKGNVDAVYNEAKFGAILSDLSTPPISQSQSNNDFLEESLKVHKEHISTHTGVWLKFEGTSESRISSDSVYLDRKRGIGEYVNRTFFPKKPTGIKQEDTLFLTVLSWDNHGNGVPIIVGYAQAEEFDEKNVISTADPQFHRWNDRFPFYIRYTNGRFLKAPVKQGISLLELCRDLKHQVYPSTVLQPNVPMERILARHHQKSHLQITEDAKDYLIRKLEDKFSQFGYDEVK